MATNAEINVNISQEFRNTLLELVVEYLIDQPPDFLDFAIAFLTNKKSERLESTQSTEPEHEQFDEERPDRRVRRKSVFAEIYNPEEEEEFKPPVYPKGRKEKSKMMESLKNVFIFRSLDQWQKDQILDAMVKRDVTPGEVLIKQGEEGDYCYTIESGVYEAWKEDTAVVLNRYVNAGCFGELALLYNVPRACSIKAVTGGVVWALDRATFRKTVLTNAFKKRRLHEMLIDEVPLLSALNEYERMALADTLVTQNFQKGERIIAQGDEADGMYFIEQGTVKITVKDAEGKETEVKRIEAGEYFGELALLTRKPRAASAYAAGAVRLAFLDLEAFERLLGPCMEIMKRKLEMYEEQLNQLFNTSAIDSTGMRPSTNK